MLVQGTGTVKRGPAIAQQSYECPGVPRCWIYGTSAGDEQKFSVTPLWSAINLTTPGTPEVAPGTIEIPPYPMNTVFKITSNPLTFKGINVPIRVLTWQWLNAAGVPSYIQFAGGPLLVQRSAYITERGSMVVTAFVNGVEQVDTVKVIGPEIRLTLQKESMLPSQIYTGRNKPDTQMVQVSVVDRNDQVMPNRLVNMTLSAVEGAAGHAHINSSKPKPAGLISPQVNTGPTGTIYVKYTAPDASGPVKITASSNGAGITGKELMIKVPGLVSYAAGPDYGLVGSTTIHPSNHYATTTHISMLQQLASDFRNYFPTAETLKYNDSSLELGGVFDVKDTLTSRWQPPHRGHRFGNNTDLRTHNPVTGNPILTVKQKRWIQYVWYRKLPPANQNIIDHTIISGDAPHFHLVY